MTTPPKKTTKYSQIVEGLSRIHDPLEQREFLLNEGFEFFDDGQEGEAIEALEEQAAKPGTERQKRLTFFFERTEEPCQDTLNEFIAEKNSDTANLALIRRYFKQGNTQLKGLILYGLKKIPWDTDLLDDLVFFNEFKPVLKDLIKCYGIACRTVPELVTFKKLAEDFYHCTSDYGYGAFYALLGDSKMSPNKKKIVEALKKVYESIEQAVKF